MFTYENTIKTQQSTTNFTVTTVIAALDVLINAPLPVSHNECVRLGAFMFAPVKSK